MELTCIVCPRGCTISYDVVNGEAVNITGNSCPRGKVYCETEIKAPTRMLTSTVPISGGHYHQLPVITSAPIPKEKIFEVMDAIHAAKVQAPVKVGDVIISDVAGTGIDILASRSMN
ncbi:MAG: DUF1667 domain-containing protein [Erysipelotrichaceae bacterium]|nr:DUF1667 domain-containing protein [Erysipelotrichaceae bacterium]